MFEANDQVKIVKPYGVTVIATINSVKYRNGAWIALVTREDTKQLDVWVWNDFQTSISVHKIT